MGTKRQDLQPEDNDRPIEDYPGYLGHYFDGSYFLTPALEPLEDFPWREYRDHEGASEETSQRTIEFLVRGKRRRVVFDRDEINLASFLELFPGVLAKQDPGGEDWGPASGGVLVFCQKPRYSLEEIADSAASCRQALDRDFETIKKSSIAT